MASEFAKYQKKHVIIDLVATENYYQGRFGRMTYSCDVIWHLLRISKQSSERFSLQFEAVASSGEDTD